MLSVTIIFTFLIIIIIIIMQNLLMTKSIEDIRDLFILSKIDFNQEMHNCGKTH